ncbi:glutamate receptor 2-like [Symsagittifera roscoffensis]|uniref:glutamate receptor 2-like n=1 Tax=Symsagittifera roscoffensis TaxID=84072 RepID=UPI00307B3B61
MLYSGSTVHPIPNIIQSYADAFDTAHVTFQQSPINTQKFKKMFQILPSLNSAIHALMKFQKWGKFAVIYDQQDALETLTSFVNWDDARKDCGVGGYHEKCVLKPTLKYVNSIFAMNNSLANIKQRGDCKNFILFLSSSNTRIFFQYAQHWQMLMQDYSYIIADLRMPCGKVQFDISGRINIICFQLIQQTQSNFEAFEQRWRQKNIFPLDLTNQLETALAYDAFSLMRKILSSFYVDETDRYKFHSMAPTVNSNDKNRGQCLGVDIPPNPFRPQIRDMFYKVKIPGVTGNIEFDREGNRKSFQVQLLDVGFREVHNRLGNWSEASGQLMMEPEYSRTTDDASGPESDSSEANERADIKKRPMRITAVLSKPFTMLKEEFAYFENQTWKVRTEHLEGFLIDVIALTCSKLNLSYEIRLVKDGRYGAKNADGTWNGMIGELLRGEADVALAPLTITSMRLKVVDFTKPYMTLGISIMMQKPQSRNDDLFSFLQPLHTEIWLCCILAYFSVSVVLFLVSRLSACHGNELELHPVTHDDNRVASSEIYPSPSSLSSSCASSQEPYGIFNCLWFSLGSFMQQGGDICPRNLFRSFSARLVACSWWFFTLTIISSYTANLAAFLTVDRMKSPITGAEDLASQTKIEYGTLDQSSSQLFFQRSSIGTYQRMYLFMQERNHFTKSTAEGVQMVQENPNFAFLMESVMMEYYNHLQPCSTFKVGPNLNVINYGLATPRTSPYLSILTIAILELQEKNEIYMLKAKWWYRNSPCSTITGAQPATSASEAAALRLNRVGGIFYLLVGTLIVGILVALVEILYVSLCQAYYFKAPFITMIKANVRLAVMSKFNFPGMKPTPLLHLQPPSQIPLNQEKPYPYSLSVNRRAIENDFNSGGDSFDLTEGSKGSDTSTFKRRIKGVSLSGKGDGAGKSHTDV